MKKLSFLTSSLFTIVALNAQSDSISLAKKQKSYMATVRTMDNRTIKGSFYSVNDSQLVMVKSSNNHRYIPAENIKSFSLQRKNSALRGALIGFGIGAITGIVIGFASGDDPVYNEAVMIHFQL